MDIVAGDTAQWLKTQVVLPEDQGMIPSTHKAAPNHLFQGLRHPLLTSVGTQHLHGSTWTYMRQNTHTHKINVSF